MVLVRVLCWDYFVWMLPSERAGASGAGEGGGGSGGAGVRWRGGAGIGAGGRSGQRLALDI